MAEFHKVISVSEIPPGEMKAVVVEGKPIALYNVNGEFFATCDTCSHEEASLAEGRRLADGGSRPSHVAWCNVRGGDVFAVRAAQPIATGPLCVEGGSGLVVGGGWWEVGGRR